MRRGPSRFAKVMMYGAAGEIIMWIVFVGLPVIFIHPHLSLARAAAWSGSTMIIGWVIGTMIAYRRKV